MSGRDPGLTPEQRLNRISEHGLCIGCGLCQSVAGPERVRMAMTPQGHERPVIRGDLDHETVDRIYDVCPATRIEGLPEALIAPETTVDRVWGPYLRIMLGHAADPDVRHKAATGGVLSALAAYLLDTGRVEFILHVAASRANPMGGERHISIDAAGVMQAAGSRYGP
ncbi:MAG: coenzyme F420 hydrogenase/dehydrogenase beta subunit N-terminal domain-containing protein, partial [Hyphomicrobiales bacterium]